MPKEIVLYGEGISQEDAEQFWAKIDRSGGEHACWHQKTWNGRDKYGFTYLANRKHLNHRLAYALTYGPFDESLLVRHFVCDHKPCCNPSHLRLGTLQDNGRDQIGKPKQYTKSFKGEDNGCAQLSEEQVIEIRSLAYAGVTYDAIAERFGITVTTVSQIARRITWAHLDDGFEPLRKAPERHFLTDNDKAAIKEYYATGKFRQSDLAHLYGVTQTTVSNVIRQGRTSGRTNRVENITFVAEPPKVFLAGYTQPVVSGIEAYFATTGETWKTFDDVAGDPEAVCELGGRLSYASWENAEKKSRGEYLQDSIISHGHTSVLEHLWFNLLLADVPRSIMTEFIRHRVGTAYSWQSQRYQDKRLVVCIPPRLRGNPAATQKFIAGVEASIRNYRQLAKELFDDADTPTMRRKRAKEAARAVLGNTMGTDGLVSLNARSARHIIALRTDEHADLSFRELAYEIYRVLKPTAPGVFADAQETVVREGPPVVTFNHEPTWSSAALYDQEPDNDWMNHFDTYV